MKVQHRRKLIFIICIILFVASILFVVGCLLYQKDRGDIYEEMQEEHSVVEQENEENEVEETKPEIPIDFAGLQEKNGDIYAWIRIPNTVVDYPLVQHPEDDSYYLNRTVEGKSGLPGSIYTETLNSRDFSDRNTVIYGHNMKNGSMFGDLSKYMDATYMKEHGQILIYTPEHIYTYQVFGAITYDNRHIMYAFDFSTDEGLQTYLDSIKGVRNMSSYIDETVEVSSSDKIITLSTCTGNKSRRFLVEAVLVDVQ